jgi:isopentenyldiphosphate isomerase/pimeloyl-ACP methyl ester carboxylesterase
MNLKVPNKQNELLDVMTDGADLHEASRIVVFVHGFGTSLHERGLFDHIVGTLTKTDKRLATIRFSWSGFGDSEGKPQETTLQKISSDFECVLDYVYKNANEFSNVAVVGFSMGNIVVAGVLTSKRYRVYKVVCINPADFKPGDISFKKWLSHEGAKLEGEVLVVPRADGTVTRMNRAFWDTLDDMNYKGNLAKLCAEYSSILVRATDDTIVDNTEVKTVDFSEIIELPGEHNFSKPQDLRLFLDTIATVFSEKNTIVDEDDNVVGAKARADITNDDLYRVASLWLRNGKGQVLLARRALTKSHDPGKWGPAVAGTVEEGDDYLDTIRRETFEELGLKDLVFELGPKKLRQGQWKYYSQKFFATTDKDISDMKIQKDEVDEVCWFDEATLPDLIRDKPEMFIPSMQDY